MVSSDAKAEADVYEQVRSLCAEVVDAGLVEVILSSTKEKKDAQKKDANATEEEKEEETKKRKPRVFRCMEEVRSGHYCKEAAVVNNLDAYARVGFTHDFQYCEHHLMEQRGFMKNMPVAHMRRFLDSLPPEVAERLAALIKSDKDS